MSAILPKITATPGTGKLTAVRVRRGSSVIPKLTGVATSDCHLPTMKRHAYLTEFLLDAVPGGVYWQDEESTALMADEDGALVQLL